MQKLYPFLFLLNILLQESNQLLMIKRLPQKLVRTHYLLIVVNLVFIIIDLELCEFVLIVLKLELLRSHWQFAHHVLMLYL